MSSGYPNGGGGNQQPPNGFNNAWNQCSVSQSKGKMNTLMWCIAGFLLLIVGEASSTPGAGDEGAPKGIVTVQSVSVFVPTSDTCDVEMEDNDPRNGEDICKKEDGTVSDGQFKDDLAYEEGICILPHESIYRKLFAECKLYGHGEGRMKYNNGSEYDGQWRKALMKGILQEKDGTLGEWLAYEPHGKGKMKYNDGREYDGHFKYGLRHGKGILRKEGRIIYDGEWAGNKMHGKGKYTWPNGDVYDGDFAKGKRHGKAKMKYNDGREYDGMWLDDTTIDGSFIQRVMGWFGFFVEIFGLPQWLIEVTWHFIFKYYFAFDNYLRLLFLFCGNHLQRRRELAEVKAAESKEELDDDDDESINDEDE